MRGKELKKSGFGEQGIGENGRLRRGWYLTIKGNVTIKYRKSQDKVEANLEVIDGAGVRGGAGKLETRRQRLGIRNQLSVTRKSGHLHESVGRFSATKFTRS